MVSDLLLDVCNFLLQLAFFLSRNFELFVPLLDLHFVLLVNLVVANSDFLSILLGSFLVSLHPLLCLAEFIKLALTAQPESIILPLLKRVVVGHKNLLSLLQEAYFLAVLFLEVPVEVLRHTFELTYAPFERTYILLLELAQIFSVELEACADDLSLHGTVRVIVMLGHLLDESDHVSDLPQTFACPVCRVLFTLFNAVANFIPQVVDTVLLNVLLQGSHGLQATLLLRLRFCLRLLLGFDVSRVQVSFLLLVAHDVAVETLALA